MGNFPPEMVHTTSEDAMLHHLRQAGYQLRKPTQVKELKTPLNLLNPNNCSEQSFSIKRRLSDFGEVGLQAQTFTERYYPEEMFFKTIEEYDAMCGCPRLYHVQWTPGWGKNIIFSAKKRKIATSIEVLHLQSKVQ